jgi:6-pyruvoyltetrahydropterin/6-carboxytetrahydropterin synthase
MTKLTRRYAFSASHRLHSRHLTAGENERVYGKCNNPFGHGHNYVLDVTAAGAVDPDTGVLIPLPRLDRLVKEKILTLFAYSNLNTDIPQFAEVVPTTENLALVIAGLLDANWSMYLGDTAARLDCVRIEETGRNSFELRLRSATPLVASQLGTKGAIIHA